MTHRTTGRIGTLDSLREHLQWAVELEHATLPPYLTALYSLDAERNAEAVELVSSVFVEEMLHLALAANLLNAVGGRPRLDMPEMLPPHPRQLPHGEVELSLVPFGTQALEMFLRLERPAQPNDAPQDDGYRTIGQFYAAIEQGMRELCDRLGEPAVFGGDPARQVSGTQFRHTAGRLVEVKDLKSALAALAEIVEQGEGNDRGEVWDGDNDVFHPEREEVGHYYRFLELKLGRRFQRGDTPRSGPTGEKVVVDPDGVAAMVANPRPAGQGGAARAAQEEINRTYCGILHLLEQAFNGDQPRLGAAVGQMFALKAQVQALMALPGDAGPTFEYVAPQSRS
ncbi:ferritin-like protein [Nonomuraea sp. NPDC050790]|uniref:ferritin-like protein n=1 Tax=Nonomuraea sp. NPDC050790 TaxID=3364371 RepID=UPI0037997534